MNAKTDGNIVHDVLQTAKTQKNDQNKGSIPKKSQKTFGANLH